MLVFVASRAPHGGGVPERLKSDSRRNPGRLWMRTLPSVSNGNQSSSTGHWSEITATLGYHRLPSDGLVTPPSCVIPEAVSRLAWVRYIMSAYAVVVRSFIGRIIHHCDCAGTLRGPVELVERVVCLAVIEIQTLAAGLPQRCGRGTISVRPQYTAAVLWKFVCLFNQSAVRDDKRRLAVRLIGNGHWSDFFALDMLFEHSKVHQGLRWRMRNTS